MVVVPNSCFSVLFVHEDNAISKTSNITLNVNGNEFEPILVFGEWVTLKYKIHLRDEPTKLTTFNLKTFVTQRHETSVFKNGFLGISPCQ